jgi:hypothetical protein
MLVIPLLPPLPVPKPPEPEEQAWLDDVAELRGLRPHWRGSARGGRRLSRPARRANGC